MALQKLAPAPIARYVTVQDAVERIGVAERTLRRWIEETNEKKKKFHRIMRDPSGFVRLDLEEVEQIVRARGGVVPSVHQQIESLLERIEVLESEHAIQAQRYQELLNTVEHFQQARMTRMQPVTHRHSGSPGTPAERRGLPPGTLRLVDFARNHVCKLSDVKKLYGSQEIEVAVYQREAPAVRNKQEWWVTPAQHHALADYYGRHHLAYTPCPRCFQVMQEEQKREEQG